MPTPAPRQTVLKLACTLVAWAWCGHQADQADPNARATELALAAVPVYGPLDRAAAALPIGRRARPAVEAAALRKYMVVYEQTRLARERLSVQSNALGWGIIEAQQRGHIYKWTFAFGVALAGASLLRCANRPLLRLRSATC